MDNFITIKTLEDNGIDPLAFRYLCLTAHYRSKLFFSLESLKSAARALERFRKRVTLLPPPARQGVAPAEKKFYKAINNDLDMPAALAIAWNLLRSNKQSPAEKMHSLMLFDLIFGLDLNKPDERIFMPVDIQSLIEEREKARADKMWRRADEIRALIRARGFEIDDTTNGPVAKPAVKSAAV